MYYNGPLPSLSLTWGSAHKSRRSEQVQLQRASLAVTTTQPVSSSVMVKV